MSINKMEIDGLKRKVSFHNLGCKVNSYETQAMSALFSEKGYEVVDFSEPADICIINTCTVTNVADQKSRQMLHKARKMNPDAFVVAVGCYVQADPVKAAEDAAVDLVIGNQGKKDIVDMIEKALGEDGYHNTVMDIRKERDIPYENFDTAEPVEHTRADIKIQDGCDRFCTYCLIPYVRGPIRSRRIPEVLKEVRHVAQKGYKEIVIAGIHISSYGRDIKNGEYLLDLLEAVHEIEGIERIRLGSLEPGIITPDFAESISRMPKICPHFHLSLQSGSATVLKRMNRHYTPEAYYEKAALLRTVYDDPALTTDVITGFPGETKEEFEETYAFLEKVRFYETHIFPYSLRKGTKAAEMPGQIAADVKKERSQILSALNAANALDFRKRRIGKALEVLFEEEITTAGIRYQTGRTKDYIRVAVKSDDQLKNQICKVTVCGFLREDMLLGDFI